MTLIIEIGLLVIGGVLTKGFIEPLFVAMFNRVVMPNLGDAFSERINGNMGSWLGGQTGESLADALVGLMIGNTSDDVNESELRKAVVEAIDKAVAAKKLTGPQMATAFKDALLEADPRYKKLPVEAQNALAKVARKVYDPVVNAEKNNGLST